MTRSGASCLMHTGEGADQQKPSSCDRQGCSCCTSGASHTLNLASQAGLKLPAASRLLEPCSHVFSPEYGTEHWTWWNAFGNSRQSLPLSSQYVRRNENDLYMEIFSLFRSRFNQLRLNRMKSNRIVINRFKTLRIVMPSLI